LQRIIEAQLESQKDIRTRVLLQNKVNVLIRVRVIQITRAKALVI